MLKEMHHPVKMTEMYVISTNVFHLTCFMLL